MSIARQESLCANTQLTPPGLGLFVGREYQRRKTGHRKWGWVGGKSGNERKSWESQNLVDDMTVSLHTAPSGGTGHLHD